MDLHPSEFYPLFRSWRNRAWFKLAEPTASNSLLCRDQKPLHCEILARRMEEKDWMQRLFGRILKPSMADLGVEKWIASLADIPASRLVLLEKLEKTTQDTSGQTSKDSLGKYSHQSASSKMFPTILRVGFEEVAKWPTTTTGLSKLRRACLQHGSWCSSPRERLFILAYSDSFRITCKIQNSTEKWSMEEEGMVNLQTKLLLHHWQEKWSKRWERSIACQTILQPNKFSEK